MVTTPATNYNAEEMLREIDENLTMLRARAMEAKVHVKGAKIKYTLSQNIRNKIKELQLLKVGIKCVYSSFPNSPYNFNTKLTELLQEDNSQFYRFE